MNFDELHATIPYVKGGKEKVLTYSPYPNVTIAMPGRHAGDTSPVGGDFVVMITDSVFKTPNHQFTHDDIFDQIEVHRKTTHEKGRVDCIMIPYLKIVQGGDPLDWKAPEKDEALIYEPTFYAAIQCLAVAEHRRYARYENKFGGRFLPFRFAAGIDEGLWTAEDAKGVQRMGRPGVEMLERKNGKPALTQELMK